MKQIGTDFQGWPVNALTLREILHKLGFEEDSETITLVKGEDSNKLLDSYPLTLEDDGMGYGARNGSCNDAIIIDNETNKEIQLWF